MSKRRLLELVQKKYVSGWDDPRMPTICGCAGVVIPPNLFGCLLKRWEWPGGKSSWIWRCWNIVSDEHLNKTAPRVMAVLDPVKVVIDNYPEGETEYMEIENNPEDVNAGVRKVAFARELFIERDDFMEDAPKKFFRLTPGQEVRLKGAYIIKCTGVDKDAGGNITLIHCTYDPESRSGSGTEASNRKVKGTLHWVAATDAIEAEVRLYDRLFKDEDPAGHKEVDFKEFINEDSLRVLKGCKLESSMRRAKPGDRFQFQRLGYFCVDPDSTDGQLVINRTYRSKIPGKNE